MKVFFFLHRIFTFLLLLCVMAFLTGCPKPDLQVSAQSHHFSGDMYTGIVETDWEFQVWNAGEKNSILYYKVEPTKNWIIVNPTSGKIAQSEDPAKVSVHINRDSTQKAVPSFATGYIKVSGGGKEKVITVTTVPNFYTEVFGGLYNRPFDLSNTTLVFIPDGGLHFYKQGIKKNVQQFPQQPPDMGNPAFFVVQDPFKINSSIAPIPFYGVKYEDIYVSSKGYISFGAKGLEPITVGKHFAYPQISLLPIDALLAEEGGGVIYSLLPQKVVISWINIPLAQNPTIGEDGKPFKNNIQVELFYDGKIQITYLSIDPKQFNAVVGLSCGVGDGSNPPVQDFVISDLSSAPEI